MSIEFRCPKCNKLLQTPDDTAGKHARCPVCGAVAQIPVPGSAPAEPVAGGMFGGIPPVPPDSSAGPPPAPGLEPLNPYQAPTAYGVMPREAPLGDFRPTIIDVGDIFHRTWAVFKQQWGMIWLAVLIVFGINLGASMMLEFVEAILRVAARQQAALGAAAILVAIVGQLAIWVLSIWLGIGQAMYFLKLARGQPADLGTLFAGGPKLITALLASLLYGLAIGGVVFLFLIPGLILSAIMKSGFFIIVMLLLAVIPAIVLSLMFSQFLYLIVDRDAGVIDSLKLSGEITRGNKATLFGIGLLMILLFIAAVIPLLLGLLIYIPFATLMPALIYLAMTGQPTVE